MEFWKFSPDQNKRSNPQVMRNICTWEKLASHFLVGLQLADLPFCLSEQVEREMRERKREYSAAKLPEFPPFGLGFAVFSIDHWDKVTNGQKNPINKRLKGYSQRKEMKGTSKIIETEHFSGRELLRREILSMVPLTDSFRFPHQIVHRLVSHSKALIS